MNFPGNLQGMYAPSYGLTDHLRYNANFYKTSLSETQQLQRAKILEW